MEYITSTLGNLIDQTAFMNLTWGNLVMIGVACLFLYLAIRHGLSAAAACSDCLWYASRQYLPGHYDQS